MDKRLWLLILSDVLILSSFGLIGPIFAIFIMSDLEGGSIETAGLATTVFLVVKSVVQLPLSRFFIDKEKRGFGGKFILWCDDELRKEGVQVVYHHIKAAHNWGKMIERLGYQLQDLIYCRRLD